MTQTYHLDADDMAWSCHAQKGVSYKTLRFGNVDKSGAMMVHMCAGATYPEYIATEGQDVLVVDGELKVGDQLLPRGSYMHVAPGDKQSPSTETGCVLFVSFPGAIKHSESQQR